MLRVAVPPLSSPTSTAASSTKSPLSSPVRDSKAHNELRTRRVWKSADAVCFDVDSTVCQTEAIDELAEYLDVGEEVAAATRKAMNGVTRFRDALDMRLKIMKPSRKAVEDFARIPPKLTPGIAGVIAALHKRGTHVYLVSGGFRALIRPVADLLSIPHERIYANEILFTADGGYDGFDKNEPTSDSGSKEVGKAGVCGMLKKKHGYKNLVMVGDGATDLEACPPADAFIGFGGNAIRAAVRDGAPWFVTDFEVLKSELQ